MTIVELTDNFIEWLESQEGVTSVGRVDPGPYDVQLIGHESVGLYIDGIPVSVEFNYTP